MQSEDYPKLRECPFCGSEAHIQGHGYETAEYRVYCEKCGCSTKLWSESKDKAVSAWNRRAQPENKPADAVPVVRCKDCIHFERLPDTDDLDDFGKCLEERGEATMAGSMVFWPDEMYCSDGERRADDGQDN